MKKHVILKCISLIYVFVVLCLFITATDEKILHLEEVGLSLPVPFEYEIFTHGTKASDPRFAEMGLDGKAMEKMLGENLYLSAIKTDFTSEIAVTMAPNKLYEDYNLLGVAAVKVLVDSFVKDLLASNGIELIDYSFYQHQQALFVEYICKSIETGAYAVQYSTVYDGKDINITFWSYDGEITSEDKRFARSIAEETVFDADPKTVPAPAETPSFVYKDSRSGTSFTVPRNWVEKSLSKERTYITAKFADNTSAGTTIVYGGFDMWEAMTPAERFGTSRSALNSDYMDADEMYSLLEEIGCEKNSISKVTFGDYEYYRATYKGERSEFDLDFVIEIISFVRIQDGWLYQFQFYGDESSKSYDDFVTLIKSVKYPPVESTKPLSVKGAFFLPEAAHAGGTVLIVALVIAICVIFGLVCLRAVNKKKSKRQTYTEQEQQTDAINQSICHVCGTRIPEGNAFCHKCGAKVNKEN